MSFPYAAVGYSFGDPTWFRVYIEIKINSSTTNLTQFYYAGDCRISRVYVHGDSYFNNIEHTDVSSGNFMIGVFD